MATTVARVGYPDSLGSQRALYADVTLSSSYPANGEPVTLAQLGFSVGVRLCLVQQVAGYVVEPVIQTNGSVKLKVMLPSGGAGTPAAGAAPVATGLAATGASTASAVDATRPTVAILPGVSTEMTATRDLSAKVVRCLFIGA